MIGRAKFEISFAPNTRPPCIDADVIHIPNYSRWFSWDKVDSCELRFLLEFFDGRYPSKTPNIYMYYQNSIIKQFWVNPSRKISFNNACKTLMGDVGSIRKYDSTLCVRCYVWGNFRVGLNNADFWWVEITDEAKGDWSEKKTLLLLEAIMHYGDDWKKEYLGHRCSNEAGSRFETNKRMRLTPLADASNPIMAQATFLSALVGVEIAKAAVRAAVTSLSEVDDTTASKVGCGSLVRNTRQGMNGFWFYT
ncbi:hypothetical protein CRYUN_Cryun27aG0120300 [Craigia yunnanensis]